MTKFLKLLFIFLFPIIIGIISFEFLLRKIPNDYAYKKQYLDKNSEEIEILYLGNSHIYYGINPELSKNKSFNCSHISQSLIYDLKLLRKYEGKLKNLKTVVIPIDYFSMYSSLESGIEKWRVKNYAIYYEIKDYQFSSNFEILNGKLYDNLLRLTYYINKKKNSSITSNKLGFGITYNSSKGKNLEKSGISASKRHTKELEKNPNFLKNKKAINEVIKLSKEHNFSIIFVTCPAYKTYTERLNNEQLNNTINFIKGVVSKNKNTHYYNFLNDSRFISKDFYDADHLNEIGAEKFTHIMDSLAQKL
jgi:hypothetical protein